MGGTKRKKRNDFHKSIRSGSVREEHVSLGERDELAMSELLHVHDLVICSYLSGSSRPAGLCPFTREQVVGGWKWNAFIGIIFVTGFGVVIAVSQDRIKLYV